MFEFILTNFKGEIAALSAAFLWAISSTIYVLLGVKIPPLLLNLSKGLIAIILIIITVIFTKDFIYNYDFLTIILLALSGLIGIGIGDTAYFNALNNLGARKTLLLETLTPPLTTILAFFILKERLNFLVLIAIFIVILGVYIVISEKTKEILINQQNILFGLRWALLGIICQSIGSIISRFALSTTNISPLMSTFFRLLGGLIIMFILSYKKRHIYVNIISSILSIKLIFLIIITAFFSTYLGILLQQTSLKFASTGIAQTLMATSPLFVIPISFWLGEKISFRSILGVLIALIGVSLFFVIGR